MSACTAATQADSKILPRFGSGQDRVKRESSNLRRYESLVGEVRCRSEWMVGDPDTGPKRPSGKCRRGREPQHASHKRT
jgi:hypothetical protein